MGQMIVKWRVQRFQLPRNISLYPYMCQVLVHLALKGNGRRHWFDVYSAQNTATTYSDSQYHFFASQIIRCLTSRMDLDTP